MNDQYKILKYPQDWDIHVLKTCELFFDNIIFPDISYICSMSFYSIIATSIPSELCFTNNITQDINLETEYINIDKLCVDPFSTSLRMLFKKKENSYCVWTRYKGSVLGQIFWLIEPVYCFSNVKEIEQKYNDINIGIIPGFDSFFVSKSLGFVEAKSPYDFAFRIGKIISNHNGNDDGFDFLNIPHCPNNQLVSV